MNEKSLNILSIYDFDVYKTSRGRGGIVLNTNYGTKMLYECNKSSSKYELEDCVTQELVKSGFINVDSCCRNVQGNLISESDDGRKYIVKNWFNARECDMKSEEDICESIKALATLHKQFNNICSEYEHANLEENLMTAAEITGKSVFTMESMDMSANFDRHTRELKMIHNYLKNKKKRNEFERIARDNFDPFYREAVKTCQKMKELNVDEEYQREREKLKLCHGNFNYHNILFTNRGGAIINFDKCRNDFQISDLYQFMRKILEKTDWNMECAYKMMDEYDKVKPISKLDLKILGLLFTYPEKFWKIVNYYFNSNKSWIPRKSIEKLDLVLEQNDKREKFVDTIA